MNYIKNNYNNLNTFCYFLALKITQAKLKKNNEL